ncbi:MAG: YidC/Oxa1 family membrane protein insertase [Oscillospiraceae bacterium]|nr:YidC/Oxa1 family membrane protein insertase [Oscillospiraceae bacterium]
MDFAQIILTPFVWLLIFFYNMVGNYGLALIMFAVVVKVVLFPFSIKGKRSMIQMNAVSGKMQQLQKQYGSDRARYNQEVQALYAREKVNPMGGCLWSLIPLFVLWPLYAIIRQPLKYMMGLSADQIEGTVAKVLNWGTTAIQNGWAKAPTDGTALEFASSGYNQLYLSSLITPENLPDVQAALGAAGEKVFSINFDFLGLNLASSPTLQFWTVAGGFGLFLLPIISAVLSFITSRITSKTNAINNQTQNAQTRQTNMMMMIISPVISLWIGFSMPAGLCVYWIANNVLTMVQELLAGRILKKDYERVAAAKAEQERLEKEEEKRKKKELAEQRALRIEEAKNNKGKKPPQKKKSAKKEKPAEDKDASRSGMRQYARGHAYDPTRYGEDGAEQKEETAQPEPDAELETQIDDQRPEVELEEEEAVDDPEGTDEI